MTCSSDERDLLMDCASFSCSPTTPDLPTRSEPARSTRCNLPLSSEPSREERHETYSVRTRCERDELAFIRVPWVCRRAEPDTSNASTSAAVENGTTRNL